jgi:hypothetical protein
MNEEPPVTTIGTHLWPHACHPPVNGAGQSTPHGSSWVAVAVAELPITSGSRGVSSALVSMTDAAPWTSPGVDAAVTVPRYRRSRFFLRRNLPTKAAVGSRVVGVVWRGTEPGCSLGKIRARSLGRLVGASDGASRLTLTVRPRWGLGEGMRAFAGRRPSPVRSGLGEFRARVAWAAGGCSAETQPPQFQGTPEQGCWEGCGLSLVDARARLSSHEGRARVAGRPAPQWGWTSPPALTVRPLCRVGKSAGPFVPLVVDDRARPCRVGWRRGLGRIGGCSSSGWGISRLDCTVRRRTRL